MLVMQSVTLLYDFFESVHSQGGKGEVPERLKSFSVGRAAKITYGRPEPLDPFRLEEDPVDVKSIDSERLLCKKKLLAMKARSDSTENFERSFQQEDIQEWLDNLHYRLYEARHLVPGHHQPGPVERRSTQWSQWNKEPGQSSQRSRSQGKARSRSVSSLAPAVDSGAALTDSSYLEQLQQSLRKASISSLQERLAERQAKDETSVAPLLSPSVRPKTVAKRSSLSEARVAGRKKSTASLRLDSGSSSSSAAQRSQQAKTEQQLHKKEIKSALLDMNTQKVDDIYRAAEQLILPPVRQQCFAEEESSRPTTPAPFVTADAVEVEDYWDLKEI